MSNALPVIAVTMGDPAGIGPELAVRAASAPEFADEARFVLYGEESILAEAFRRWGKGPLPQIVSAGSLPFAELVPGEASARCGELAYDALTLATKDVRAGRADALVTAPMNKYSVNLADIPFTGHTERIAELCGASDVVMMQSADSLRIAFVTTHIPLAEVARWVTVERILITTRLLADAIRAEDIANPRIAVAAINPHAGENGFMGKEDETVTRPAVEQLRREGLDVEGPLPPDTVFTPAALKRFDGVISMYHDQGHIPLKMVAFDRAVNSTLGLPLIRTSPDHGTAFDIAWQGKAHEGSFFAAIRLALKRIKR